MKAFLRAIMVLALFVWGSILFAAPAGELVQYTPVRRFTETEIKDFFNKHNVPKAVLPAVYGINIYEVVYTTTYTDSSVIKASGLLYVPMGSDSAMPIMIYNHGTEFCRERNCSFTGEQTIALAFATDGYIVLTPDYVGLGEGDKNQLYLHAGTEARASVDMLLASQKVLTGLSVKINHQLFVAGYSQGGHAAMATSQLLQQQYSHSWPVTASGPMSGPYDIASTVYNGRNEKFIYPAFFYLLLKSYFDSEGRPGDLKKVLQPPYDSIIPPMLDGSYSLDQVDALLPDTIINTVRPQFYDDFVRNSSSGFRKFLYSNNVYNWAPKMPMQLCYCNSDEEVPFQNTITAYNTMKANGSTSVKLLPAGKKFGHIKCALFSVVYTKLFFDRYRTDRHGRHGEYFKRLLLNLGKLMMKGGD